MNFSTKVLGLIGRMLVGANFVLMGVSALSYWEFTKNEFAKALASLELRAGFITFVERALEVAFLHMPFIVGCMVVLQLLGGIALFFGYRLRLTVFFLFVSQLAMTIVYHHFWLLNGLEFRKMLTFFSSDCVLLGALLLTLLTEERREVGKTVFKSKGAEAKEQSH